MLKTEKYLAMVQKCPLIQRKKKKKIIFLKPLAININFNLENV